VPRRLRNPWARFDDLRAGTAWRCPPPHRVLATWRLGEVVELLAEVDRRTAAGDWAFGYVAYEAAPAFDPGLAVVPPAPSGPPLGGWCTSASWETPGRSKCR